MGWSTTSALAEFLAEAGAFLRAAPAQNTVILSVTEHLRRTAATVPADQDEPLFGWWRPDASGNAVGGAFMHTPPFPVFLSAMTGQTAAALAGRLAAAGRRIPGVNGGAQAADAFAAGWRQHTGGAAVVRRRMRLFRLGALTRTEPAPGGAARVADERDRDLLISWFEAFTAEVEDEPGHDYAAAVDYRLGYGGITIWAADDVPVSMACVTPIVVGVVRIGPVYTPPPLRGRGYAGGATAAASQAALDAGAGTVVLYTDLANPTSNALYQRLGYRAVEDRLILSFTPAHPETS